MLNSNIGIRELLLNEKDSVILATVNEIQALYSQLDGISITNSNFEETEYIIKEIKEKENDLISNSSAYQTYIDRMNCNWQSIQKEITDIFTANNIKHFFTKGSILCNIYDDQCIRTRGDIDVFVSFEDVEKAKNEGVINKP